MHISGLSGAHGGFLHAQRAMSIESSTSQRGVSVRQDMANRAVEEALKQQQQTAQALEQMRQTGRIDLYA